MSLWKIAWRSIQQRALASTLTAVSMGLGVALVVAVLVVYGVVHQSFRRGGEGYDLIVGAKGSRLQLVLNSAFYLGRPVGNIPYEQYEQFTEIGKYAQDVEMAVPICMGHSYEGYAVVGTTPEMFDLKYLGDKEYKFAEGNNFESDNLFDAVIGSTVARDMGLTVGSEFQAVHGLPEAGGRAHKQPFNVVGILAPTGTPNDRALFVNMKGFWRIHRHEHATGEATRADESHEHDEEPGEVTAVLVCVDPKKHGRADVLAHEINKGTKVQAALPLFEIAKLFENIIGDVQIVLLIMAVLIVVVAGLGIMVSIYNSMSDRRHEIAVMRALGASRLTVMAVILLESILLSLGGGGLGLVLGHGLIGALSPVIAKRTAVAVGMLQFQTVELLLIPGLIVLASVVGYLPAVAAYRTDVARSLTATP